MFQQNGGLGMQAPQGGMGLYDPGFSPQGAMPRKRQPQQPGMGNMGLLGMGYSMLNNQGGNPMESLMQGMMMNRYLQNGMYGSGGY